MGCSRGKARASARAEHIPSARALREMRPLAFGARTTFHFMLTHSPLITSPRSQAREAVADPDTDVLVATAGGGAEDDAGASLYFVESAVGP